ncbi:hypothetical protein ACIBHX_18315 [Nonomuraea sp. NPDC050536]|uniref:hypothetical protein n=1 Tax=Nonomuraea sp. NPDC050536 TaxID=3364366 RepID=UPI0037CAEF26
MATRSTTVLATGSANTAKFFVAALAFTAAYVGVSAYGTANSAPSHAETVTLSARELPITSPVKLEVDPGAITVSELPGEPGCAKAFLARGVVTNPEPRSTIMYGWRLARWNPRTNTWRTYQVDYGGFTGTERTVDWETRISGNPGWYRFELRVDGAKTVRSDRFQVSC